MWPAAPIPSTKTVRESPSTVERTHSLQKSAEVHPPCFADIVENVLRDLCPMRTKRIVQSVRLDILSSFPTYFGALERCSSWSLFNILQCVIAHMERAVRALAEAVRCATMSSFLVSVVIALACTCLRLFG